MWKWSVFSAMWFEPQKQSFSIGRLNGTDSYAEQREQKGLPFVWCVLMMITLLMFLGGCSEDKVPGAIQVKLIQPTAQHCKYAVAPAQVLTLASLSAMSGAVGRVVYSGSNLSDHPEVLDSGVGLKPVDVNFVQGSGGVYSPLDYDSLFAASLYYSIERGYLLFAGLDPRADLAKIVPSFSNTTIVHQAQRNLGSGGRNIHDNAEYLPYKSKATPGLLLNYFLSYPTADLVDMPLGLNLGIMVHEFTHMVFHYLFFEPGFARNEAVGNDAPTANTLASLDEGMADYFGFLASGDPGFFDCSAPDSNRNLAVPKAFTDDIYQSIASDENFDPHVGGAIWAAMAYEMGQALGNQQVIARSIVAMMVGLLNCPAASSGTNTLSLDFGIVAKCHMGAADPAAQGIMQQVYSKYLGRYGSGSP